MKINPTKLTWLCIITLIAAFTVFFPAPAIADESGLKAPTTCENTSTMHHPEAAYLADNVTATADRAGEFAIYKYFALNIPANSTVNGIEVTVLAHADSSVSPRTYTVTLYGDAGAVSTGKNSGVFGTTNTSRTAGNSTDTWGRTWSLSDLTDDHFRIGLMADSGTDSIYLDRLQVRVYFTRDTTPPTVTINQAAGQLDPTGASPINFTAVFSEPVTGLTAAGITISGTAGATTAVITGSGTTYNVAVSGMTTSGTVIAVVKTNAAHDGAGNNNSASTSTDNMVTYNNALPTLTITVAAGANGTIIPGTGTIDYGATPTYTITPNTGYHIANVLVDNVSVGAVPTYQFVNVTANHSISATFEVNKYTVLASIPGGHGTVSPTTQSVNYNNAATINITPNPGFYIAGITDNGTAVTVANPYVISNINSDHNVVVTLNNLLTVSASVPGGHGTVSPVSATVVYGSILALYLTPDTGYHLDTIVDNGNSIPAVSTYTLDNIVNDHEIMVTFAPDMFTITANPGPNGSISPGTAPVPFGASPVYSIVPSPGFQIVTVNVDNTSVGTSGTYQFQNVASNHVIAATFEAAPTGASYGGGGGNYAGYQPSTDLGNCPVTIQVSVLDSPTLASTTTEGITCSACTATSSDKDYQIHIAKGTKIGSIEGVIPKYINFQRSNETFPAPEDGTIVSSVFEIDGYADSHSGSPVHMTFEPTVELALAYDETKLSQSSSEVSIAYYDQAKGWTTLEASGGPAEVGTARGKINHFTPFAVIASTGTSAQPSIKINSLTIKPGTAAPGQEIKINAAIVNSGQAAGQYKADLFIDGTGMDSQRINLNAGESKAITFTTKSEKTGVHKVLVNELSGQFEIAPGKETGIPWWVWVILVIVLFCIWRFRKYIIKAFRRRSSEY